MPTILFGISSSFCAHFMKGQVGYLVAQGYRVVIISGPGKEIELLCADEGAELITVLFSRSITPFHDLGLLFRLMGIIRDVDPDIINAGNPKPGLLLTLAAWLLRRKGRVFTLHGLVSDARTGFRRTLISSLEGLCCRLAQKVLVVSPSLARHAISRGILPADKSVVLGKGSYNGINLQRFQRSAEVMQASDAYRQRLGITERQMVFGYVGRITADKGIGLLLQAFTQAYAQDPECRLVMAGPMDEENPLPDEVMKGLQQHPGIRMLGQLDDIVPIYPLMQVLVLSSYREGFGNVLLEAAAMDIPVIAPAIPGCSDAMRDGVNGLSFRAGDADDLYKKMQQYIQDPALRHAHAQAGRAFAAGFDPREIWTQQLRLYTQVMDK